MKYIKRIVTTNVQRMNSSQKVPFYFNMGRERISFGSQRILLIHSGVNISPRLVTWHGRQGDGILNICDIKYTKQATLRRDCLTEKQQSFNSGFCQIMGTICIYVKHISYSIS